MYFFRSIWWRVDACKRLSVERSQEHNAISIIFTVLSPFVSGTIPTRIWKTSLDLCFTEYPPHATHHPFTYEIGCIASVFVFPGRFALRLCPSWLWWHMYHWCPWCPNLRRKIPRSWKISVTTKLCRMKNLQNYPHASQMKYVFRALGLGYFGICRC